MSMKQIETLVFDYGGVIVNIDDASVVKAMESLGVTAFKRLIHVRKIKRLMHQYINGMVAEAETLQEMLSLCRKGTSTEDIEKVLEEHQRRNGLNAVLACCYAIFIHIHLDDTDAVAQNLLYLFQNGVHRLARLAPCSKEINQNKLVAIDYVIECLHNYLSISVKQLNFCRKLHHHFLGKGSVQDLYTLLCALLFNTQW